MKQIISINEKKSGKKMSNNSARIATRTEMNLVTPKVLKTTPPRPIQLPDETDEERALRLAKRKALTLKAFQATYKQRKKSPVA